MVLGLGGLISAGTSLLGGLLKKKPKVKEVKEAKPYEIQNTESAKNVGISREDQLTAINDAKDLARYRLGLDKEQSEQNFDFRNKEAQANFGRDVTAREQISGLSRAEQADKNRFAMEENQRGFGYQRTLATDQSDFQRALKGDEFGYQRTLGSDQFGYSKALSKQAQDAERQLQTDQINQQNLATNRAIKLASRKVNAK